MTTPTDPPPLDPAAVLAALTGRIINPVGRLAAALGYDLAEVELHLAELIADGLAEVTGPDGAGPADLRASLSPLAAARLGLKPDGTSRRWIRAGAPDQPPQIRPMPGVVLEVDVTSPGASIGLLDTIADEWAVDPHAAAAQAEADGKREPTRKRRNDATWSWAAPAPRVYLGVDVQWPPRPRPGDGPGVCPVCRGGALGFLVACLWCDRAGTDKWSGWRPPATRVVVAEDGKAKARGKKARKLAGGTGKAVEVVAVRPGWAEMEARRAISPSLSMKMHSEIGARIAAALAASKVG